MGVNTDATAVPFHPPAPQPGIAPSGITMQDNQNIRGMANKARQDVSSRQQNFLAMMRSTNSPSIPQTAQTQPQQQPAPAAPQQMYRQAAAKLVEHADTIDKFVDWVLFE